MVASYAFGDFATTTLSATVSTTPAAGTSEAWTVVSTSVFPAAATGATQFTAQISNPAGEVSPEVVLVTNTNNSTHFQVQRGYGGTIKTHAIGDVITLVIDSAWLALMEAFRVSGGGGGGSSIPAGESPFPLVTINVGDTWQTVVNGNPTAKTFLIKAGVHQNQFVTLAAGTNDNLTFLAEAGAVADGGMITRTIPDATTHSNATLTSAGNHFAAGDFSGTTPTLVWGGPGYLANAGAAISAFGSAGSVTLDDTALGSQTFTATLVRAPNASCTFLFAGNAKNIKIKGLEIRNYASIRNRSAIFPQLGDSPSAFTDWGMKWTVENCIIHDNAVQGARICHGAIYRKCLIYNNGDIGLCGNGIGALVEDCEAYNNNAYLNNVGFDAAAMKFALATEITVRRNYVHDNNGSGGIWFDVECSNGLVEGNICSGNSTGIMVETSYNFEVRGNCCWDNGSATGSIYTGGGNIVVSASEDVNVHHNDVGKFGTGACNGIVCLMQNRQKGTTVRTVSDGVFNGTTTVTSATALFDTSDEGAFLYGPGITGSHYVVTVNSATSVVVNATIGAASGQTINIARASSNWSNPGRGLGQRGFFQNLFNVAIHHNNIRALGNILAAGLSTDVSGHATMFSTQKVKYWANSYAVNPAASVFAWDDGAQTFTYWKDTALQDVEETHTTPNPTQGGIGGGTYTLDSTTTYLTPQAALT